MSKKRIISEAINIRINVGNYQHIEITKQAQEEIEYDSEEQRLKLEESLQNDLISGIIASMKLIPERLNKGVANAQEVEQAVSKAIPEWLDKGPVPNIANVPKKVSDKISLEQKANKDQAKEKAESLLTVEEPKINKVAEVKSKVAEVKPEVKPVTEVKKGNDFDIPVSSFDDEDLFEDEEPVAKAKPVAKPVEKAKPAEKTVSKPAEKVATKQVAVEESVNVDKKSSVDDFDFFDSDVESLFN